MGSRAYIAYLNPEATARELAVRYDDYYTGSTDLAQFLTDHAGEHDVYDSLRFDVHYSHDGAYELRIADDITSATPFGQTDPPEAALRGALADVVDEATDPDAQFNAETADGYMDSKTEVQKKPFMKEADMDTLIDRATDPSDPANLEALVFVNTAQKTWEVTPYLMLDFEFGRMYRAGEFEQTGDHWVFVRPRKCGDEWQIGELRYLFNGMKESSARMAQERIGWEDAREHTKRTFFRHMMLHSPGVPYIAPFSLGASEDQLRSHSGAFVNADQKDGTLEDMKPRAESEVVLPWERWHGAADGASFVPGYADEKNW